ncbi:hypothetical protein NDU88_006042 [Pleurodeles waltl]|uniref:Uncharacterized protein n=1 Tax=Pleurodeles waltl TaxID=8319 RepID=A0AAV7RNT5_PLEWA|nr:hypothetical protein NDU88_006042 [Pleurodeles waltl]
MRSPRAPAGPAFLRSNRALPRSRRHSRLVPRCTVTVAGCAGGSSGSGERGIDGVGRCCHAQNPGTRAGCSSHCGPRCAESSIKETAAGGADARCRAPWS